jgi:hypothetical protein
VFDWYVPSHISAWIGRWFSLRSIAVGLVLVVLLFTEFRFNWIENVAGTYLVSTNRARPQSGTIWEQGEQSLQARQELATYMNQRQVAQREARQAATLGQVIAGLGNGNGAMISAEHFVELYLKLPPVLSHEIISPFSLLNQLSTGQWQRTYFDRQGEQLLIYMLDTGNQVVDRLVVGPSLLANIQRGEVAVSGRLEQLSDLANHVYAARRFFSTLNALPAAVQQEVIAHPEELLRVSGRVLRVGISDDHYNDTVDLGFEVEAADGFKVVLMQGRQDAVYQLQRALEGSSFFLWRGDGP